MSNTNNETTVSTQTIAVQAPVKRGRGRPKGSKNKPKNVVASASNVPNEVNFEELGNRK